MRLIQIITELARTTRERRVLDWDGQGSLESPRSSARRFRRRAWPRWERSACWTSAGPWRNRSGAPATVSSSGSPCTWMPRNTAR